MKNALDLMDQHANAFQREHQSMQNSLRVAYSIALDRDLTYAKLRDSLIPIRAATEEEMFGNESASSGWVDEIMNIAEKDTGLSCGKDAWNAVVDYAETNFNSAELKVRDALTMDQDTILRSYREILLRYEMARASGKGGWAAAYTAKTGAISDLNFYRQDRAGKRWSTDIYTRTVIRGLFVSVYIETYLMTLVSNGITEAVVEDGGPVRFSITGDNPNLPSLEEMKTLYWHPNASRLVSH